MVGSGRKWWDTLGYLRSFPPPTMGGAPWNSWRSVAWGGGKAQTLISSGVGPWAMCRVGLDGLHFKVTYVPKA